LLSDGSSDRALLPLLTWLLHQKLPQTALQLEWADLIRWPRPLKKLADKMLAALDLYPCDLLFVHRDAERESREKRAAEIRSALANSADSQVAVCVVPVRMQEAWMLIDEQAIRFAAGNPHGHIRLALPRLRDLESLPDPKAVLYAALQTASELQGRRLRKFLTSATALRVAEFVQDWAILRHLQAFCAFEEELDQTLGSMDDPGQTLSEPHTPSLP